MIVESDEGIFFVLVSKMWKKLEFFICLSEEEDIVGKFDNVFLYFVCVEVKD